MDISLTPELERRIAEKVESGLYANPSDVVREGLRRLFGEEDRRADMRAWFNAEIDRGLDDFAAGRSHDADEVFAELEALILAEEKKREPGR